MTANSGTVLIKFEFKKNYFSISLPGTSRTIGTNLCFLDEKFALCYNRVRGDDRGKVVGKL